MSAAGPVIWHDFVGSTNELAKVEARGGAAPGTAIAAKEQLEGKGRMGRAWHSPRGGLWFSVIYNAKSQAAAQEAVRRAADSIIRTLDALYGLRVSLKSPNDVLLGCRKLCGILVECGPADDGTLWMVMGVGLNANIARDALPAEIREGSTTLLEALGRPVDIDELLSALLSGLDEEFLPGKAGRDGTGREA